MAGRRRYAMRGFVTAVILAAVILVAPRAARACPS
jgi:hypothetical protein